MSLLASLPRIAASLREQSLDGWLLASFQDANPIAMALVRPEIPTRTWFCLVTPDGSARLLVQAVDQGQFSACGLPVETYTDRPSLVANLRTLLAGAARIAMEYSPMQEIPYISRVDGGILELVRSCGVEVRSSAELVQIANSLWDGEAGLASHRRAERALRSAVDVGCSEIRREIEERGAASEYAVQQRMLAFLEDGGMETDGVLIVAANPRNADPHYFPTAERDGAIARGDLVMFDLWCREAGDPDAIWADITWMACAGHEIPVEMQRVWEVVRGARDAAFELVRSRITANALVEGWEVDRAARDLVTTAGYGEAFVHRTGHSIQREVHATGVNIDDFEIHDTRRVIRDCGFSIEPGIYLPGRFGVRSEINVYVPLSGDPVVTGDTQSHILPIFSHA